MSTCDHRRRHTLLNSCRVGTAPFAYVVSAKMGRISLSFSLRLTSPNKRRRRTASDYQQMQRGRLEIEADAAFALADFRF